VCEPTGEEPPRGKGVAGVARPDGIRWIYGLTDMWDPKGTDLCKPGDGDPGEPSAHNAIAVGAAKHTPGDTFMFKGMFGGKPARCMFDSGAKRSIADQQWLERPCSHRKCRHGTCLHMAACKWRKLVQPLTVMGAGSTLHKVTHECTGQVEIQKHKSPVTLLVMDNLLQGVDVILGMDWLQANGVNLHCGSCSVSVMSRGRRVKLKPVGEKQQRYSSLCTVAAQQAAFEREAEKTENGDAGNRTSDQTRSEGDADRVIISAKQTAKFLRKGASAWLMLVQPDGMINTIAAAGTFMCSPKATRGGSIPAAAVAEGLVPEDKLASLGSYRDVFNDKPQGLPPERDIGHPIPLEPGHPPPFRRPRRLTPAEEAEVKRQVADLLERGLIEPTNSPYGAPVVFVQKKAQEGKAPELRMCVDYRALNKITVKDRFPLPRIDDLLSKLRGRTVFSALDLASGYMQIRIPKEDVPKTAFVVPGMGSYAFRVLSFGLTNAPATFQRVMQRVFAGMEDFIQVYLDDILVMSRTPEEHLQHLEAALQRLREWGLYAKMSKCVFNRSELKFLGHVVGKDGVAVDPDKIAVIQRWPVPRV